MARSDIWSTISPTFQKQLEIELLNLLRLTPFNEETPGLDLIIFHRKSEFSIRVIGHPKSLERVNLLYIMAQCLDLFFIHMNCDSFLKFFPRIASRDFETLNPMLRRALQSSFDFFIIALNDLLLVPPIRILTKTLGR